MCFTCLDMKFFWMEQDEEVPLAGSMKDPSGLVVGQHSGTHQEDILNNGISKDEVYSFQESILRRRVSLFV